jgi:hypothetical protein
MITYSLDSSWNAFLIEDYLSNFLFGSDNIVLAVLAIFSVWST